MAKSSANKGEKKQQEWINVVNNILNSNMNLSNEEKSFLRVLSKYDNIPRKKAKFLNFVRNAMGQRKNPAMVDSIWAKMEEAYKSNSQNNTGKQPQGNGKSSLYIFHSFTLHTQQFLNTLFDVYRYRG